MWSLASRTAALRVLRITTPVAMAVAARTGMEADPDKGDRVQCQEESSTHQDHPPHHRRHPSRLRRKHTILQHATGDDTATRRRQGETKAPFSPVLNRSRTQKEMEQLKAHEKDMLLRWQRDEDGWRELPARAWPAYQPSPEQLKGIEMRIRRKGCSSFVPSDSVSLESDLCTELLFQAATTLVFYNLDPQQGFEQFEHLAKRGHVDSMVACGIILVEGMGIPAKEEEGIQWLQKAVDRNSPQGYYEMGTLLYTGVDGVLDEDPEGAFELFQRAAEHDHTAGLYMMADCLLEGEGTKRNVGRAIPLLYRAAERGHRFARQRIRELLATYSSRPL